MMKINKDVAMDLGTELQVVLEEFARKHNLSLSPIRGTFTETTLSQKIVFTVKTDDGQVAVSKEETLKAGMEAYEQGIPYKEHVIGTVFRYMNVPFKVLGLKPRARKNPWRVMNSFTGATYRVSAEWLKENMK